MKIYLPPGGARVALAHAPLTVGVGVAASDAGVAQVVVLNGVEKKCSRYIKKSIDDICITFEIKPPEVATEIEGEKERKEEDLVSEGS